MSIWLTAGVERWGFGYLDAFFAECKRAGVDPLVLAWVFGDAISTAAILNGVNDPYQKRTDGKPIFITKAKALSWLTTMAQKATAAGVKPIVAIEHEFAQEGLETDASAFGPYFDEASAAIRKACPDARIAFCCPIWEDENVIGRTYAKQIAAADIVGSQTLLFPPRHGVTEFRNAGLNFTDAFANLRRMAAGKPTAIIDLGFSSYGGAYAKTPPFAGGDGRANEALQAEAIASIAKVPDLDFVVYRALRDDPSFNTANYGGYAERHVGVVRSDGTKKPAHAALIALSIQPPPPPTPLEQAQARIRQLEAMVASTSDENGLLKANVANLNDRIATATRVLTGP